MDARGALVRRLTSGPATDSTPVVSPDGRRVAFTSDRGGGEDVWTVGLDGSGLRQVTRLPSREQTPAWSPDGRLLAFASDRDGGEGEVYVSRAHGSRVRRVTRTARGVLDLSPSWSPDGRRIVLASSRFGFFNVELVSVEAAGGGAARRLTRTAGSDGVLGDDAMPDHSPDDRRIAFVSNRAGRNNEVWAMDPDGRRPVRLTRTLRADEILPRWSPDGRRLVFTRAAGGREVVWTMAADGSAARRLTRGSSADWLP